MRYNKLDLSQMHQWFTRVLCCLKEFDMPFYGCLFLDNRTTVFRTSRQNRKVAKPESVTKWHRFL